MKAINKEIVMEAAQAFLLEGQDPECSALWRRAHKRYICRGV